MDIKIEQACPQCGAPIVMSEHDRLLTCPYCEVKNFMLSNGAFRYVLQAKTGRHRKEPLLYVPYLRFKGNIFLINEVGIGHKVTDTTQIGIDLPGLPPSLGVRPQAMPVKRLLPQTPGRYLPLTTKARAVLEKVIRLTPLRLERRTFVQSEIVGDGEEMFRNYRTKVETVEYSSHSRFLHRAFIGETVSFVYLPVEAGEEEIIDGVTGSLLMRRNQVSGNFLQGKPFNPRWQVHFMPTLCPRCGWSLDGEGDSLLMTCKNCDTAWALGRKNLEEIRWRMVPGDRQTALYLGFWKISGQIPALDLRSFADFIERTNQPILVRPSWHEREMSFWIPAFKLRPKVFLRVGRQATIGQWRLEPEEGHVIDNLYPVTLPASEAEQSVKVILAASAASRKKIFPFLPKVRLQDTTATLVYLPFVDKGHDWYQPESGITVAKSVLRFGRSL